MAIHTRPFARAPSRTANLNVSALPRWQPQPHDRILIFAPHPDDETLATGGVIASALAHCASDQIQVVIATNGDSSRLAAIYSSRRPFTRDGFRHLAARRQHESLDALQILGLAERQVQFWGFPDRGLQPIWLQHWGRTHSFRSPATGYQTAEQAYQAPQRPYTAEAVLDLSLDVLSAFQPTLIFIPHPEDAHPDHRSLGLFVLMAAIIHQAMTSAPDYQILAYPMWLRGFPLPASVRFRADALRLPTRFTTNSPEWLSFALSPDILRQKALALRSYHSQAMAVGGLLQTCAQNPHEVFAQLYPSASGRFPNAESTHFV